MPPQLRPRLARGVRPGLARLPLVSALALLSALSALALACGDGSDLPSGHWQAAPASGSASSGGTPATTPAGSGSGGATGGASSSSGGAGGVTSSGGASSSGASSSGAPGGGTSSSSGGSASGGSGGASSSSGAGSSSGSTPTSPPDLAVTVDQASLQMQLLASSTVHVSVAPNGYSGPVALQIGSAPAGVTVTFQPASLMLDGTTQGTSTLTVKTVDSSPPGTVSLDVQATAAGTTAHQSVSVEVQSVITIHIPAGVNQLGGTVTSPVTDAYGPYPFKIVAPQNMSAQTPVTVYFMNDDDVSHEIHADNPQQGFGHDPGPFAAHSMDPYVRQVNTPGAYDFYLHDQGAPITVGLVEIH